VSLGDFTLLKTFLEFFLRDSTLTNKIIPCENATLSNMQLLSML
jgi:hypothetical protein